MYAKVDGCSRKIEHKMYHTIQAIDVHMHTKGGRTINLA